MQSLSSSSPERRTSMQNATLSVVAALALATAAALPVQAQQTQQGDKPEVVAKAFTAEVTGQVESVDARTGTWYSSRYSTGTPATLSA